MGQNVYPVNGNSYNTVLNRSVLNTPSPDLAAILRKSEQ